MIELSITESVLWLLLVSVMIFYMVRKRRMSQYLQLPGPSGIPYFGNFFQMDRTNLHLTLDKWGNKYGEMFRFHVMGKDILVVNSSEIARELYLKEPMATLTAGRMPCFFSKYIVRDLDIVFCPYSEEWSYRRKTGHQLLRVYGEGLREIENQLTTILEGVSQKIKESENNVVDPTVYVDAFILDNLEVIISGVRGDKDLQKCIIELDKAGNILSNPSADALLMACPLLRYIPGYFSDLFNGCLEARDKMMHKLQYIYENNPTYLGMYRNLVETVKKDEKKEKRKLTFQIATYILQNMVGAGYLTTHGTLMSTLKILISRPNIQTKIQEEIFEVIGSERLPQIKDREYCHYTEAFILETLRYISHTPIIHRCATDQFEFRGTNIPKGCIIFLNAWHIHHNGKEFEDPYEFKPERFLDNDGKLLPATDSKRKRLFVFGVGKRSCIGEVLARSRIFLFLAYLMQHFSVTPPDEKEVRLFQPTEMKPGLVMAPTDFTCKFVSR